MNCLFCKIAKKEIPSDLVFENDEIFSFLDIHPVSDGHILVIPKAHYEKMTDTPDELLSKLFVECKKLMIAIKKALNADYVAVSVVGVDIPHFHIHLVPRRHDDGLAGFWPTKEFVDGKLILEKIKKALD
ncbi:MAG: HIT family protein [Candidatus Paceibacterota bacterium]|jgi:histidine triad (HIT) family protein